MPFFFSQIDPLNHGKIQKQTSAQIETKNIISRHVFTLPISRASKKAEA
jgi:hypothetical protein